MTSRVAVDDARLPCSPFEYVVNGADTDGHGLEITQELDNRGGSASARPARKHHRLRWRSLHKARILL